MTAQNTLSISELEQKANAGDALAQFNLAASYAEASDDLEGSGELALMWLTKSAEQGHSIGELVLGIGYLEGIDNKLLVDMLRLYKSKHLPTRLLFLNPGDDATDAISAFTWLKKAAEHNCKEAQYALARCFQDGIGIDPNEVLAFEWYRQAAEHGLGVAQDKLAHCYLEGKGIEQNDELAIDWFIKATEQGNANGKEFFEKHSIVFAELLDERFRENDDDFVILLTKVASQGVAEIQYRLALRYFTGKGVQQNVEDGMEWMIKAAVQGHAEANNWFANAYLSLATPSCLKGKGKDDEYFKFAANQCTKELNGDNASEANLLLGVLYLTGKGVEQSDDRAFDCFYEAERINGEPQEGDSNEWMSAFIRLFLLSCYAQGKGFEKELSQAKVYADLLEYDLEVLGRIFIKGIGEMWYQRIQNNKLFLTELMFYFLLSKKEYEPAMELIKGDKSADDMEKYIFKLWFDKVDNERQLDEINKQLQEKEKDLEDMMSMFAHKFRSPLDAIIYNTSHDNNPKLYAEAAQTMRGLLDIFSIISTDDTILPSKIKADCQGNARLSTVLNKTLNMILLHLLSASGTEKIHQHYLAYAKAYGKIGASVTDKEWYDEHFELEQTLQAKWEQDFAALLSQSAPLAERLAWLEQHFFKLELIGFDRDDIQFKEYAITESLLTILLNEILVNAFKYYSSETRQAVVLEWSERDGKQILSCRNPSVRRERRTSKGSGKGHTFLSALARKIGGQFTKPKPQDDFVLEFGIPNELLVCKS